MTDGHVERGAHRPGPGPRVVDGLPAVWIFTGSRKGWTIDGLRDLLLRKLRSAPPGTWIMHGNARGADEIVDGVANEFGLPVFVVPYIGKLGKAGGPERNMVMATAGRSWQVAGHEVHVYALWAGHGTKCVSPSIAIERGEASCHCGTLQMAGMAGLFSLPTTIVIPTGDTFDHASDAPELVADQ
jgi:hypothetical protein